MKRRQILAMLLVGSTTMAMAQSMSLREYARNNVGTVTELNIEKKTSEFQKVLTWQEIAKFKSASTKEEEKIRVLYDVPGSLFMGVNKDGAYSGNPTLLTPALKEVKFVKFGTKGAKFTWSLDKGEGPEPVTTVDEFNNALITPKIGLTHAPTLTAELNGKTASYDLTQNTYPTKAKTNFWFGGSDLVEMSNNDPCLGNYLTVDAIENSEFRVNHVFKDTGKKIDGFAIVYDKPLGDLYVKSAYMFAIKNQQAALLAENDTLYADFIEIKDGKLTNNILATGKATIDNITEIPAEGGTFCYIEYPLMALDEEFGVYEDVSPTVFNKEFMVVYRGLGKKNIDISLPFAPAWGLLGTGYAVLEDGKLETVGYSDEPETPMFNFNAGLVAAFPSITVIPGSNIAVFDNAGGVGKHTATYPDGTTEEIGTVLMISTIPVDNENKEKNYEVVEGVDWIPEIGMAEERVNAQMPSPVFVGIELHADPLPEGVKGRYGEMKVKAQGQVITIICKQGDTTGIEETTSEEKATSVDVLNVSGQMVGTYPVNGTFTLPSELADGAYILKYNNGKVVKAVK